MKLGFGLGLTTSRAAAQLPPIAGTVETYGDSVMAIGAGTTVFHNNVGLATWMLILEPKITALTNYAVGGDASGQLATQITGAGATGNNFAVIHVGSNDAVDGTTTETFMTNLRGACSTLKGDGKRVAVCVPIQRNDTQNGWTSTMQDRLAGYWAAMIAEPAGTWDYLVRTDQVPEWSTDGIVPSLLVGSDPHRAVHPNPEASYYIAKKILAAISDGMTTPSLTTKATAPISGSTGYKDGNFTGDSPDGWSALSAMAGCSVALSQPTAGELQMTLSGTSGTGDYGLVLGQGFSVTAGERLRVKLDLKSDASLNGLVGFGVGLHNLTVERNYSLFIADILDFSEPLSEFWPSMFDGDFVTVHSTWLTAPATETLYPLMWPVFQASTAVAGSVTVRNVVVEKA